jgi:hypothetical protein
MIGAEDGDARAFGYVIEPRGRLSWRPLSFQTDPLLATVSLYVVHYNLCRVHVSLRRTPAVAIGVADRVWTIGASIDAALATQPITPTTTAADRRKRFRVIEGGLK